ncbi:MAG: MotA/TolQ/ExbB proton channel family protein [candidate division KSB1 bacterium]|nr:MotA/TolQ/ExbB proton channel family protein [candidate division KSB1 bacterium]MDZ7303054.1 MotA/TolQ/ExbB proton channel family protein [candidate division KSB1 bacterium]MDZ7312438.1 MotA/TolQ/ExbB proton channel family protein [candidate division KSB1 bacterium]
MMTVLQNIFVITALAGPSKPQQPALAKSNHTTSAVPAPAEGSPLDKLSAWDILWMCEEFTWPFIILTTVGVALVIHRFLMEYRLKLRAQSLLAQPVEFAGLSQFVKMLNVSQPNRASQLFQQMIATFNKTRKADHLQEDISNFMQGEKDTLDAHNRIIVFLSDTAGALGLLGTVWGIFIVFYGGKMDSPTILRGMSVALITTLVGLVISLILNLGLVTIHSLFNRQLKLIGERAEELRQALLQLQHRSSSTPLERTPPRAEPLRKTRPVEKSRFERTPEPVVVDEEEVDEWV